MVIGGDYMISSMGFKFVLVYVNYESHSKPM